MTYWKIHFILLISKFGLGLTQNISLLKLLLYCTFFAIFLELCALPPPPLIICYVKVRCQSIYVWTDMTHILSELWFDLRKTSTILIDSICNVWEISQFGWINSFSALLWQVEIGGAKKSENGKCSNFF